MLIIWLGIFIISLIVLLKAADSFTGAAEKVGVYLGMPAFIVGVTIIAVGTSLPELITSIFAVLSGASEIVIGNVIGSNVTNICLGLGLLILIGGYMKLNKDLLSVDLPLLIGSAFLILLTCFDGLFTWVDALLCLFGFAIYIAYTLTTPRGRKLTKLELQIKSEMRNIKNKNGKKKKRLDPKLIVTLIVSAIFIFLSAKYTVESLINLSRMLGVGAEIVAASAVALGTSLPEIVTGIILVRKKKFEMGIGTLLGSNIFNAFAIMGIAGLVGTLVVPVNMIYFGIPMLVLSTLMFFFITQDREITKWEGWLLLIFYAFFILKLFNLF